MRDASVLKPSKFQGRLYETTGSARSTQSIQKQQSEPERVEEVPHHPASTHGGSVLQYWAY